MLLLVSLAAPVAAWFAATEIESLQQWAQSSWAVGYWPLVSLAVLLTAYGGLYLPLVRATRDLAASQERDRLLRNTTPDGVITIGVNGRIQSWNRKAQQIFGWRSDEVLDRVLMSMILPRREREKFWAAFRDFRDQGDTKLFFNPVETTALRRNGREFPAELTIVPVPGRDELTFNAFVRDITDRKHTAAALKHQSELLTNIISIMPYSLFWKDLRLCYLGCNLRFAREGGLDRPEELVGKSDFELPWSPEQARFFRRCDRQVISRGESMFDVEVASVGPDGREATILVSKLPIRDSDGDVVGILGVHADITERKQVERALQEAEEKYRSDFRECGDGDLSDDAGRAISERQ